MPTGLSLGCGRVLYAHLLPHVYMANFYIQTEPRCLIDTELVSSYFRSYDDAPVLDFLKASTVGLVVSYQGIALRGLA